MNTRSEEFTLSVVCNVYTDEHDAVAQAQAAFQRLWNRALTEQESSKLILSILKNL